MRLNFPFRKLIVVTACCAASVVALMSPAHADESIVPFIRDALVGQSAASEANHSNVYYTGGPNEGRTRSEVQYQQGAEQNYERVLDGNGGPRRGDDDIDWFLIGSGVLLALLMGIAGTLGVEYYLGTRRRTA